MNWFHPTLLTVPAALMISLGFIPEHRANRSAQPLGWLTTLLAGLMLLASLVSAVEVMSAGPIDTAFIRWASPVPFCLGIHVDAITFVMTTLISFIGLIIARYSMRYLLGDPGQGRFFRWMSFTLGSTLMMVMSCNLVMFTAAWMLTSFGLDRLLTHYQERSWAIWAARKKFLISRIGDAMLVAAVVLTYRCFGTTEYCDIFAAIGAIHESGASPAWPAAMIGILLVLGAMTKSAQFPFHSWLPDTMETPTPVSALMHAGVINAGGFLIIRLSPLVSLSPVSLDLVAVAGSTTALFGSVVMMTQTSVKRSLAYSTIAQMGFMMLQCGLGAFSAALLHIVAHSAYKAHAFLSCGSVVEAAARGNSPATPAFSPGRNALALGGAAAIGTGIVFGTFRAAGVDILAKPGGAVLGLILTLAVIQLVWNGLATGVAGLAFRSAARALLVTAAYALAYLGMDRLVAGSMTHPKAVPSWIDTAVLAAAGLGFLGIFAAGAISGKLAKSRWARAAHVHAMNGFYIDIPARRLTAMVYRQPAPVQ